MRPSRYRHSASTLRSSWVSCSVTTASDDGACFSSLVPDLGHDLAMGESTGRLPVSIGLMAVRIAGRRPP
jgi:hypothetical protein